MIVGESSFRTPKDRLDDFADDVEAYSACFGLGPADPLAARVGALLMMAPDELAALSADELALAALHLAAFAARIQGVLNRARMKVDRCRLYLQKRIVPVWRDRSEFKDEDKRLGAIFDDPAAVQYHEIQNSCECLARRWEDVPQRLESLARSCRDLMNRRR